MSMAAHASDIPSTERTVRNLAAISAPCLSIRTGAGVIISLERDALEATANPPVGATSSLFKSRSRELLQAFSAAQVDTLGCLTIADSTLTQESKYLVGARIEDGQAAISRFDEAGFETSVVIRDINPKCTSGPAGMRVYRLEDGKTFMSLISCVI